jgi:hypothetical protein
MRDAISAAHTYGKPIIQAEAFTELRMAWDEHPGMLKALGDQQLCLGANRLVYHVFNHNPWLHRKPGMTLDAIGLYFQRDQTWWPTVKVWTDYHARCQAMLQAGTPVVDIAVFTGEDIPSRAALPETLVSTFPGIAGKEALKREQQRLANAGNPQRELPAGVNASANITETRDWLDPLRGYAYDSVNADALLRLAKVHDGRIEFPGGASYPLLVLPLARPLASHPELIPPELAQKFGELVEAGATVAACVHGRQSPSFADYPAADARLKEIMGEPPAESALIRESPGTVRSIGDGRLIYGPIRAESFATYGIEPDFIAHTSAGERLHDIAWSHRRSGQADWYFLSNQSDSVRDVVVSFRVTARRPELWDPLTGFIDVAKKWVVIHGRTVVPLTFEPGGSIFVVFRERADVTGEDRGPNSPQFENALKLGATWSVSFDTSLFGPGQPVEFETLADWSTHADPAIRHYSGTAHYRQHFEWDGEDENLWLDLGDVKNIAVVRINGNTCGTVWTPPNRVEVTNALRPGKNELEIAVTNTWANRLIGDASVPAENRVTWMTAPYLTADAKLLPAGLLGPVRLLRETDGSKEP